MGTTVLAVLSDDLSFGGRDPARYRPNATLIGASLREVRRASTARFAERVDTNAVALYLIGVRVHVDVRPEGMNLIDRRGSAIDTLVRHSHHPRLVRSGRSTADGPWFGLYFHRRVA